MDPEQHAHWAKTVAIVGTAGFLTAGNTREGESERASLAARWENIHTAERQRDDDLRVMTPVSPWPDEPHLDPDFDTGFGL
jgi:hypothetical protein